MKKKWALLLTSLLIVFSVVGQEKELVMEQAKTLAQQQGKRIVLVFQGSDWCAPCIKLEKEILDTEEFRVLAEKQFVIVKADFPRSKKHQLPEERQKQNAALAEKYNQGGYFPYVVVLNADGKALGALGYKKSSPKDYYNQLNSFK